MARPKRRLKQRIIRHFSFKKHIYLAVLAVIVCIAAVIIGAQQMVEKEGEHKDVVKALSGTSEEQFQLALATVNAGDLEQGRIMMLRLARLGDTAEKPLGYGKAHLWAAEDMLANFETDVIWNFPMESGGEGKGLCLLGDNLPTVKRHLQHAAVLSPELDSPSLILAAIHVDQSERNKAVDVLLAAITHPLSPQPQLHIPLANILPMKGDDLAMKEKAWYLFSSLGHAISSGGLREVPSRVEYVLSALLLKKFENAEIVIRRLEAQYPKGSREVLKSGGLEVGEAEQVEALRMAYHYHRAIHRLLDQGEEPLSDFKDVVDDLAIVLQMQPECRPAIDALSLIAAKDLSQKNRIQKMLKDLLSGEGVKDAKLRSSLSLALAMIDGQAEDSSKKEYIEQAIVADPQNGEAGLRLMELLSKDEQPDYPRILKLATDLLPTCQEDQRAECHYMMGLAQARLGNWYEAIVALEKSLGADGSKARLHSLLAQAYGAMGRVAIAEYHRKMVVAKP